MKLAYRNKWHEWLAGFIDVSFHLTKAGYGSLEITTDIRDECALQIIKNIYGGSIKRGFLVKMHLDIV